MHLAERHSVCRCEISQPHVVCRCKISHAHIVCCCKMSQRHTMCHCEISQRHAPMRACHLRESVVLSLYSVDGCLLSVKQYKQGMHFEEHSPWAAGYCLLLSDCLGMKNVREDTLIADRPRAPVALPLAPLPQVCLGMLRRGCLLVSPHPLVSTCCTPLSAVGVGAPAHSVPESALLALGNGR